MGTRASDRTAGAEAYDASRLRLQTAREAIIPSVARDFNLPLLIAEAYLQQVASCFHEHADATLNSGQACCEAVAASPSALEAEISVHEVIGMLTGARSITASSASSEDLSMWGAPDGSWLFPFSAASSATIASSPRPQCGCPSRAMWLGQLRPSSESVTATAPKGTAGHKLSPAANESDRPSRPLIPVGSASVRAGGVLAERARSKPSERSW